jgi:hypothetical protein
MGVLTKHDQIEPIYLTKSVVTYISLHSVYDVSYGFVGLTFFGFFSVCGCSERFCWGGNLLYGGRP